MRVLVVEDNDDIRFLVGTILVPEGHVVSEAEGGYAGIAALEHGTYDAVLLDVQMPDLSGWDVLAAIRGRLGLADLPVVMCTVKGRADDLLHGWEAGCDGYLTKPFDIDELLGILRIVAEATPAQRAEARASNLAAARQESERLRAG